MARLSHPVFLISCSLNHAVAPQQLPSCPAQVRLSLKNEVGTDPLLLLLLSVLHRLLCCSSAACKKVAAAPRAAVEPPHGISGRMQEPLRAEPSLREPQRQQLCQVWQSGQTRLAEAEAGKEQRCL